jgi:hypothetical protein
MALGAGKPLAAEPPGPMPAGVESRQFHLDISVQNNMTFGSLRGEDTRNSFDVDYDAGRDHKFEVNVSCGRRVTSVVEAFAGIRVHRKNEPELDGVRAIAGVRTALPLGIDLDAAVDHRGHPLFEVGSAPRLAKHPSLEWRANSEREFHANVNYEITTKLALTAGYDTTHGKGVGLRFKS